MKEKRITYKDYLKGKGKYNNSVEKRELFFMNLIIKFENWLKLKKNGGVILKVETWNWVFIRCCNYMLSLNFFFFF